MAEICVENEKSLPSGPTVPSCELEPSPRAARRKRMEIIRKFRFAEPVEKRQKVVTVVERDEVERNGTSVLNQPQMKMVKPVVLDPCPSFGSTSVIGRRRHMEDSVAMHPSFCNSCQESPASFHYFGVFDGHGCSHVANCCKDRLHQIVKEEIRKKKEVGFEWKDVMERSFYRMDKEVIEANNSNCRCELQTPKCDAGSTAVVSVITPDKIVVANCGDSRAVLCRGGKAIPLSIDHKPDRPDELKRIQDAGGRVIFWDVPRVLGGEQGVLAMSRAIGDSYLKPYVSSEPEVTETGRSNEDVCLIIASDGLWDVLSNEMACGIARMCLTGHGAMKKRRTHEERSSSDKACSDAAVLLTKLALARNSMDNVSVVVVDLRRCT